MNTVKQIFNEMTKESKDTIATWTAVGMLCFGVLLTTIGFFIEPMGAIEDSVLWVLGQCLLYAGGIFGIGIYAKHRLDDMEHEIRSRRYYETKEEDGTAA